jgi:anti-sigma regulatory factor (Ser/Thr protein kinase)
MNLTSSPGLERGLASPLRDGSDEEMRDLLDLYINESSQVAEARRLISAISRSLGFSETEIGKVAIVITELATNLVKHAEREGHLIIRSLEWGQANGIEILSLDKGPGIEKIAEALYNGNSTRGSQGIGIGAIRRLSSVFDLYSLPSLGTAVLVSLWSGQLPEPPDNMNLKIGGISLYKPGEEICGDAWAMDQAETRSLILVVDGLGCGIDAAESANEAVRIFQKNRNLTPAKMISTIHDGIKHTRGAAVAVAEVNADHEFIRFAGVGNISGAILYSSGIRHLVSHNGTVGKKIRKIQEFTYPWPVKIKDQLPLLIMHSDGLATHWDFNQYPGLSHRHPSLIAGVLYRDFKGGNDDVTVVVAKPNVD